MKKITAFTLIEILIALFIFSILATITSSALYHAFTTREKLDQQTARLTELQLSISLLQSDIQQFSFRPIREKNFIQRNAFVGQSQYIEFTRGGLINPQAEKRSTLQRVAYLCENNQLIRRIWPVVDTERPDQYQDKTILENLNSCQFAFLSNKLEVLEEWRGNALATLNNQESVPKAVQFKLNSPDWGKGSFLFIIPEALYAATSTAS